MKKKDVEEPDMILAPLDSRNFVERGKKIVYENDDCLNCSTYLRFHFHSLTIITYTIDWFLQRKINKEEGTNHIYNKNSIQTIKALELYIKLLRQGTTPKHTIHMGWDSYISRLLQLSKNDTFLRERPLTIGLNIPQLYETINMTFQGAWTFRCINIQYQYLFHKFGYVKQSSPSIGNVDLAAVFMSTKKLKQENIKFGKFCC